MENETPSINDFIVTTTGGIALGEIFHRMYVVLNGMSSPLRFFKALFSPVDALNDIFFKNSPRSGYSALYLDETYIRSGAGVFLSRMDEQRQGTDDIIMFSQFLDLNIVYGEPYTMNVTVPYQNFELYTRFNFAYPAYSIDFFSNGDLYTLGLWETANHESALSLNLHYDFMIGSLIHFSGNALGLTYKSHHQLPRNWDLSFKLHTSWVFLGASEYIPIWYGNVSYADPEEEHRKYDLGMGGGIKAYVNLGHPIIGTFNITLRTYMLGTIAGAVPENGSDGFSLIGTGNISYEKPLTADWSIGVMASGYIKYGTYINAPDALLETTQNYALFIKYH
jgi:hypothetical protein